ncbi:MAG TPA: SCO family protein, partial [Polyangiales bacterium]
MFRQTVHLVALVALSLTLGTAGVRAQVSVMPAELEGVDVKEQLDKPLPKDAVFRDHEGKTVRLGDYFDGKKPVVLTLAYANCKVVCSMVLGAEVEALKQQEWLLGKEYRALTISIDPNDTPAIAAKKRNQMLALYGREGKQWDFLVGDPKNIERVAKAVGYQYKYDARQDQFAHPAVLMITKPTGELARYLYGLSFEPQDVRLGLLEASQGRSISTIEKMILYCYMYDPIGAKYVLVAKNVMRLGGAITVIVLGAFLALMWRRELRKKRAREAAPDQELASVEARSRAR